MHYAEDEKKINKIYDSVMTKKLAVTVNQVTCGITILTEIKIPFSWFLVTLIVSPHSAFVTKRSFINVEIKLMYIQIECFLTDNNNRQ